jgi:prolyl oligopeptidase
MKSVFYTAVFFFTGALIAGCGASTAHLSYPQTRKTDQSDTYFGTRVRDPYRWLENDTSAATKDWVRVEKAFTDDYLSKIPFRDKLRDRYKEILNYAKFSGTGKVGDYFIFTKNDGLQNQSVYYIQNGLQGQPDTLLNPNKLSSDGSISVDFDGFSNNKKYMAYHTNKGGSDWQTMHVMALASREQLADELEWIKFGGAAWRGDGFYYSRYDKPAKGTELSAKNEYQKVYYHRLGDKQDNDSLVYEDKAHPLMYITPQVTEDERWLLIYKSQGTDGTEVWYKDLRKGQQECKLLFKGFDFNYAVITTSGDKLLVYTNNGAGNYKIVSVDPAHPEKNNWKDIIPEKEEKLENCGAAGDKLLAGYLKDASSRIYQYSSSGTLEHEVVLPGVGSASAINSYKDDGIALYDFSSFTYAPSVFMYDVKTGQSVPFKKSISKINTGSYETEQVFYPSKDGTRIPMFIVHKKGLVMDGSHPTLLYAYGGFNISITPFFSTSVYLVLENNGVLAIPNIRGGGEYGEKWHKAGNLLNKQNCFDDFIAAASYLVDKKYTSKDRLAINGGSNGGLLVGAVITQRPDLCKVAIPEVGVMDMLRFQKFTVGWGWTVEYGSSDSVAYFPYLYKYSPLHNIKPGMAYPATLVLTADHDDRVVPAHSFKFAAALQEAQQSPNPILIRIESNQGHGASGASLSKVIEEYTDKYAFIFYNMGITPVTP